MNQLYYQKMTCTSTVIFISTSLTEWYQTKQNKAKQNKSEEWLPHLYPKCTVTLNNCANQYSFQTQVVLDSAMLSEVGVDSGFWQLFGNQISKYTYLIDERTILLAYRLLSSPSSKQIGHISSFWTPCSRLQTYLFSWCSETEQVISELCTW